MKIDVQEINGMKKDVRFEYLRQAEKTLIRIKKSGDIESDIVSYPFEVIVKSTSIKNKQFIDPEQDSIFVKVIANTSYWIDSQMDMIIPGACSKSLSERKDLIPHLHDHIRSITARVGDVKDIYEEDAPIRTLGIDKEGNTSLLIFETDIKKGYNESVFTQYKNGQVNQHSISLRYIDLQLAINDEDDKNRFANWSKYITLAINPEKAIEFGYFWIVKEYKLIENSSVLFGANELTGTLETRSEAVIGTPRKNKEPQIALLNLLNEFKLQ